METEKNEKNEQIFICDVCDFKCSYLSDWNRHKTTRKHLASHNGNDLEINGNKLVEPNNKNVCIQCESCKKEYKTSAGLWKHKKKCNLTKELETNKIIEFENENNITSELIIEIIKQNQEFKDLLLEQNKTIIELSKNNNTTNINNSMNNSHNKTFNLQFFLNETCKDAMNIMDFVDSIKIQLSDIESIGELGYVNGMSKLIIKHLNALEENMRPVHCSDPKRDSLYVKDANVWEKEDPDNKKIKKAIKRISHKNICALPEWRAKYPDCIYSDSKKSDQYNKIVIEAMGGSGDNDSEKADKIVKKIAKEVTIDKNI
jgi:hypothetical protein